MKKTPTDPQKFYDDLHKLQAKYPMCYISAWTPEDFHYAAALAEFSDADEEDEDAPPVNWDDPIYQTVAGNFSENFDANLGTNWDGISMVIDEIKAESLP